MSMTQRRAQLATAVLVAVTLAAALWLVLMIRSNTAPLPAPNPTSSPSDPLAAYKKIPPASCPPSIDPELRDKFYRQGQCPTSK